ncbi:hypothetical protein BFP77_07905 [Maribacter sp. 4U21]|uniref:hypothetical protein n=1 Tax=Maribacter sp. 4U21 TaxID=1889779 RepID=UPI000C161EE9|nr:hypothetical protein [Maribacter sp. 4U21]PIB29116.1 hypothetical protein BFP77_07905 [Maribacter sp. 4U21]
MVYKNWTPLNGTEIIGDRKATYKDGKLVVELNNYYNTDIVFSEKATDKETYYDKNGTILGTLNLEDDNGYLKAISGDRYTIDYEGDVSTIEHYEKGFVTRRTSYRKRKISEKENSTFKTVELYEPLGYKRTKEIRFYSNGKKQSEIEYEGYDKTTGTFYDMDENVLGAYNFKTKEGTVYEFFGDSD